MPTPELVALSFSQLVSSLHAKALRNRWPPVIPKLPIPLTRHRHRHRHALFHLLPIRHLSPSPSPPPVLLSTALANPPPPRSLPPPSNPPPLPISFSSSRAPLHRPRFDLPSCGGPPRSGGGARGAPPAMDGIAACSSAGGRFIHLLPTAASCRKQRSGYFRGRRSSSFPCCLASRDGGGRGRQPELDQWDQMELKFGRLLGEDPKLTMAKIMGRKANPDVSYLDIEKSFRKKKGAVDYGEDTSVGEDLEVAGRPPLRSPARLQAPRRPENTADGNKLNLVRPVMDKKMKAASAVEKPVPAASTQPRKPAERIVAEDVAPNVALRKPTLVHEDDLEMEKSSKLKIKPNLVLKMRKGPVESLSDVTLRKPEVMKISLDPLNQETVPSSKALEEDTATNDSVLSLPSMTPTTSLPIDDSKIESPRESPSGSDVTVTEGVMDAGNANVGLPSDLLDSESSEEDGGAEIGLQLPKQKGGDSDVEEVPVPPVSDPSSTIKNDSTTPPVALHGKPKRRDDHVEEIPHLIEVDSMNLNGKEQDVAPVAEHFASAEQEEHEAGDWRRAEDFLRTGERTEVELISCSSSGFTVSFGSLIGFLPYRNLGAKWKFFAFESWVLKKGLDPSLYRQNLSIMGSYYVQKNNLMHSSKNLIDGYNEKDKLAPDMKFEELLHMYDQEKNNFLSSFIGQMIRVSVVFADQKSRRLMFSGKPKEKEEMVERKRNLMARLSVGDVVKCCIKKITFFGIFVEVEGVPALIHQSEISWDGTLDPSSLFKIGQIVDAKVHQLDYALERITLSLKEIMPDPLNEVLESVIGDRTSLDGRLESAQEDEEWADVESLIKELQQVDGVLGVTKGRFFLSPGLAPTFQVYMASMYENQYKLLARYGNKVQEVLVQSSLDKEQIKATILACTNRVE